MQEPIEVKENTVEIDDNEPCSSTCADKQDSLDEFIKTLNYDEIVSSIEIVKQLQKALTGANQGESEEECIKEERVVKQEKESEGILSNPSERVDNMESDLQPCTSTSANTQNNLDEFIKTLSDEEFVSSIEIIQQLQKALTDANQRDGKNECMTNEKEEESDGILSPPSKDLDNMESEIQDCSGKYNDSKPRCKEDKHLEQLSSNLISNAISDFPDLLSSDTENRSKSTSGIYRNIIISSIKQQNTHKILSLDPVEATLNNSKASKDKCETSRVEEPVGSIRWKYEPLKCGSLTQQMRIHPRNWSFKCKACGANFTSSYMLKVHMTIHTGERRFDCKSCGAKFYRSWSLKQHVRIHSSERPFNCKSCGGKFTQSSTLKTHMRIHTGERPFDCKRCGAKFTQSGILKTHMRIHTGEKPFDCKRCGAKFTQTSNLKQHMKTHRGEGPFDCKSCGAKFNSSTNLKQHNIIHKS